MVHKRSSFLWQVNPCGEAGMQLICNAPTATFSVSWSALRVVGVPIRVYGTPINRDCVCIYNTSPSSGVLNTLQKVACNNFIGSWLVNESTIHNICLEYLYIIYYRYVYICYARYIDSVEVEFAYPSMHP